MRVLIAEYAHESNRFAPVPATRERFAEGVLATGPEALDWARQGTGVLAGFVAALEPAGAIPVAAIAASAFPSGPVDAEFHAWATATIVDAAGAGPWDGVLLSLHGAMSVAGAGEAAADDPEGSLVAAVREAVGPAVPIGVVLDLHSDTTDLLLRSATFTIAYNEEPHRDLYERGEEAAGLLLRVARGLRLVTARVRVPMLLPAINMATDQGPMAELHAIRATLERTPGLLDVSIHGGFYGSDQPEAGFSVTAIADGDPALARSAAHALALEAWKRREAFIVPLVSPAEAVRIVGEAGEPVGLVDEADDPAGGGACDSVLVLRAMLDGDVASGGVSTIFDEAAARACAAAGPGASVRLEIGGRLDPRHAPPLPVEGVVRALRGGPMAIDTWSGKTYDPGVVAALDVRGVIVVLTARKMVTENIDIFEPLGFDVRTMRAISFKGLGLHVRQALKGKVSQFLAVDGDGCTHPDVTRLGPFHRIRRPVWPLDPDTTFA